MDTQLLNTQAKDYKYYFDYLLRTFGGINMSGLGALAYTLEHYTKPSDVMNIYRQYAEEVHSTVGAVERSVRTYFKRILTDYTLDDLSMMLNYSFRPNQTTIKASEFIPILKYVLDNEE